jgi:hypothetical protein
VFGPYKIKAIGSLIVWPRMIYSLLVQTTAPAPVIISFPTVHAEELRPPAARAA